MSSVVWKSEAGRDRLNHWYDRFLSKIGPPVESLEVSTRYGACHVLACGPADGIPVVGLHAMRTGASFFLSELGPMLSRCRVYAPDLPGQSIRGPEVRLSLDDSSLSHWVTDILDDLQLDTANFFGVSWGGFVARLFATAHPERVRRLALMVPAGIANGSHLTGLIKMAFPMVRYRIFPTETNLQKLLDPIVTTWDEDWSGFFACALADMKLDPRIPPLASDRDLALLTMPTLALTAEHDISFPGEMVAARLRACVGDIDAEVIRDCRHCPPSTPQFRQWLSDRLCDFFGERQ